MIKVLELFGGIGAFREALNNIKVDYDVVDYVEIDKRAVRSYNAMFGENYEPTSVVGYQCPHEVDLLVHGSPCQDFSNAGERAGGVDGTRSSLMFETIRIIEDMVVKPKVVIWENVKGVLTKDMKPFFDKYINHLETLGYTTNYKVLNSLDFGIPQNRERIFAISTLNGEFDFELLRKTPMKDLKDLLETDTHPKYDITSPSMLRNTTNGRLRVIDNHSWTITTKQDRAPNAGILHSSRGGYRLLTERVLEITRI